MGNWQVHRQLTRYVVVGITATLVHAVVATVLLELAGTSLIAANVTAFCIAFFVSYFGNAFWSFEAGYDPRSLRRFLAASLLNLVLVYLVSSVVQDSTAPPLLGVVLVVVMLPLVGFALQKLWVFT